MSNNSNPWQFKAYPVFAALGAMIIMAAFLIGLLVVSSTANDYFGDNTKSDRDAASKNDPLQDDLVTITSIPRWLEPLIFFGVALFMIGIALEFSTIPEILQNRGQVIKNAFPVITKGGK